MVNEIEQVKTANGGLETSAKTSVEVNGSRHSASESSDSSSGNAGYKRQTTTIASSTEQSSSNVPTHESGAERTAASVTNHQFCPEMTPYENVDGKFVFTFDHPKTWHVTAVINDTSVVTVELTPTEGGGTRSRVLRIKQTLQPIEAERLERYRHDTYHNQLSGKTIDSLQFDGQTVAISISTQEQSHQWTIILPTDNGSYLVQLTTDHACDTTGQIDGESSSRIEELQKLGIQVLYSFRPKDVENMV